MIPPEFPNWFAHFTSYETMRFSGKTWAKYVFDCDTDRLHDFTKLQEPATDFYAIWN